ncbi:VOC family protein [Catenulispora subtropica]|uniref:VOC domain-containing protein n=1 Tax=Catenulispora subtropica TaxID=450798 RepID=A0ABN2RJ29_9ACTN
MTPTFAELRLLTDDFAASFAFYTEVLGLRPKDEDLGRDPSTGPYVGFTVGTADVALFERSIMEGAIGAPHAARGSEDHLVLVLRVPDVDAAYAEAEKRGAATVAEPRDMAAWNLRVAHLRAPEGTLIELCQYEG